MLVAMAFFSSTLQQYLPPAVLKQFHASCNGLFFFYVATIPTACGIETLQLEQMHLHVFLVWLQQHLLLAVLKLMDFTIIHVSIFTVATTPTVHGIETKD